MNKLVALACCLLLLWWVWGSHAPISRAPGVLTPNEPDQQLLPKGISEIKHEGWTLKPLARYAIRARVLSTARYHTDPFAQLAPVDIAVGWGRMSDTKVIKQLDIRQSGRFYYWRSWGPPPIPLNEISSHSANMHLIAANPTVASRIKNLRKGSIVTFRGLLVEATGTSRSTMRSSLSRTDTGGGACEVMWVEQAFEHD